MERGLLATKELAAEYDGVVWMYLFQDFTHSEADRAAERIAIRFGISSWPQHFLVDPFTLTKVADTGRSLATFRAAVQSTNVVQRDAVPSVEQLAQWDALAISLEQDTGVELARKHLRHADRVVAFRALQTVAKLAPASLVEASGWLLAQPNDQIRGLVCDVLARHGDAAACEALHGLAAKPTDSENPNVLRIRAVKALARCGTAASVPVVEPFATSGAYRNGLTMTAIQTLVAIAERVPATKSDVVAVLAKAFPAVPAGTGGEAALTAELRMATALARNVHAALQALTGKQVAFPDVWTDAARAHLMASW